MNLEDFRLFIESKFRLEIEEENEAIVIYKYYTYKIELLKNELDELLNKLGTDFKSDEAELYNDNYYEVLTNPSHLSSIRTFGNPSLTINDPVNNLDYEYSFGSNTYLLFVIKYIIANSSNIRISRYLDPLRFKRRRSMRAIEQPESLMHSIFDLLKDSLINFKTIKISSIKNLTQLNFEQYTYSFIFNLSYNLSYTIYPLKSFDEYFSPLKVESIVRNTSDTLECPKRIYVNDLVLHYQKALSSESLDNQYLSFYHIIEHFFEKIYNEDLQNKVRNELTKPNFSYKKKSDLENIIKIVQNRTKIQKEEFQINELEALELTLRKYILDFNDLKLEINQLNLNLFDYFKTTEVPFSKGNRVNFDLSNDEIYKTLAKRIYYTRNAIVHSKETDKSRYIPFKNDKELLPEIYLMRILTEYIIIANSREI